MRLFGLEITRTKAAQTLSGVDSRGGMSSWFRVLESFTGAWQTNTEIELTNVLTYAPVYACVRLISSDIGKLRLRLVRQDDDGVWHETENSAFSPVLRRPNRYQTRIKFIQYWLASKLIHGNTYVLLERSDRTTVRAMYVLDPTRVTPLVASDGSVFYQLDGDNLSGLREAVTVPASEIIHDVHVQLYHPLVGVSPISACGIAAVMALRIEDSSTTFFGNGSKPGGVLTAPGHITNETAARLKTYWDTNFTGDNAGKVAVLGDGLKYEQMAVNANDAQLIEQLKWTAEDVCTAFGVPPYKINVGPPPNYNNIQALDIQYYSQCLQELIESIEEVLDFALGLAPNKVSGERLGVEFNRDDLLQMDTAGKVSAAASAITSGLSPNEVRRRYFDAPRAKGGDSPMIQQQNFSLEALAERDSDKPFAKPPQPPPATPAVPSEALEAQPEDKEDATRRFAARVLKHAAAQARANATRMPDAA
jgi:HK97 family phage portal protein